MITILNKMKRMGLVALALLCTMSMQAQNKKSFTLDDLMWGGENYWNIMPRSIYTGWWGNQLVELDAESARLYGATKPLFTTAEIEPLISDATKGKGISAYNASFPDGNKTEVLLRTSDTNFLYNWKTKKIVWQVPRERGIGHVEFNAASRSEAYTKDYNLYLRTADGRLHTVSTDGSRELLYERTPR